MYPSIEVRWFFQQEPTLILNQLNTLAETAETENKDTWKFKNHWERSDYYLAVNGFPKMSYKIREGKSEIKVLDESFGIRKFAQSAEGIVEKWIKWSPALKDAHATTADIFRNPELFLEIKKERLLLKYEITAARTINKVDPKRNDLKNGCQVELTKIEYNGKVYFSFGLEALGEDRLLMDNFNIVSEMAFKKIKDSRLNVGNSCGYPAFLDTKNGR